MTSTALSPEAIAALPYRPCVGVMLINPGGLVFAAQRVDQDSAAWQMPQGGVDRDEDPQQAALRELQEETGIPPDQVEVLAQTDDWLAYDLPHELVPRVWKGRFRGQQQKWFLCRFLGDDSTIRLDTAHPEFTCWQWMAADDLLRAIVPFKRDIYARVIRTFRPWLS